MNIKWLLERLVSDNLPNRSIRALGIDLGTTNSVIAEAIWDPASPHEAHIACLEIVQATRSGRYTSTLVPSVVTNFDGTRFIGEGAKRLIAETNSIKSKLQRNIDYFIETKNEIGTNRIYNKAPADCRTPTEIGGHVLRFLMEAAGGGKPGAAVVTVPASFQASQRVETMKAASLAGLEIKNGDLFDEPVAAYVDYLAAHLADRPDDDPGSGRLLVFDYGGGTCDIALFELAHNSKDDGIGISPLSISRFHRLGGADIDAAIVYGPLLDQIVEQNDLDPGDLSFDDKKNYIEPALRSVAESLKIGLCQEISRRRSLEADGAQYGDQLERKLPSSHQVYLRSGKTLRLRNPVLRGTEFDSIMTPFFNRDVHYSRTTEYRTEQSIFAPIDDALMRGGIRADDVDLVLLAGGSSRIPACFDQITKYFSSARILQFEDSDDCKTAVARGAALQALAKALTGSAGLVTPVCHDDIFLRTEQGLLPLVTRGTPLPFPSDGERVRYDGLSVPRSSEDHPVTLRVEVVAGDEQRLLFGQPWEITPPVSKGEPLLLEVSYDANQVLQLDLGKRETPRSPRFGTQLENPLSHVVNPVAKEIEAETLEQQISSGIFTETEMPQKLLDLVDLLVDVGRREKSLEILKALQRKGYHSKVYLLNRMGILYHDMSDYGRAERLYREAAASDLQSGTPLYNLALLLKQQGNMTDAIAAVDDAISREREGAYFVFRAELAAGTGDKAGAGEYLDEAFRAFGPLVILSDFELNAFIRGARLAKDNVRLAEGKDEQKRRDMPDEPSTRGDLPIMVEST